MTRGARVHLACHRAKADIMYSSSASTPSPHNVLHPYPVLGASLFSSLSCPIQGQGGEENQRYTPTTPQPVA